MPVSVEGEVAIGEVERVRGWVAEGGGEDESSQSLELN